MIGSLKLVALVTTTLALFFLSLAVAHADPSDPLQTYDEMILAAVVIDKCHLKVDSEASREKQKEIGKAAFSQIRKNLNEQNSEDRDENGRQADFLLKKRTVGLWLSTYPKLIDQVGCAALEDRARKAISLIQ
jgi:hypothetical protein